MVEMWWGRSSWTYPSWLDVWHEDGRLHIRNTDCDVRFKSGGGGSWWIRYDTDNLWMFAHFWLGPDRMPTAPPFDEGGWNDWGMVCSISGLSSIRTAS